MTLIPGLQKGLYRFQLEDVLWVEKKDGRALIGSEMGLGKTCQALAWLQLHPEKRPAVVVCPASLKLNWAKECKMWMKNPNIQILQGKKPTLPIIGDIIIINYDILPNKYQTYKDVVGKKKKNELPRTGWINYLLDIKPKVLIIDEIHYTKEWDANRTKATSKLAKQIPYIIGLSGTIIENRPIEGLNAIQMIDSTIIRSPWQYKMRYCGAVHNGFGWDFTGATNTEELHNILIRIMTRRKKEDVLKDLPPKIRSFVPMELSNQREYSKAEVNFISYIRETKGEKAAKKASNAEVLTKIEGLKQIAVKGKLKASIDWIKNHLDTNGKLIVFCTHKNTINCLQEELAEYNPVKIDGSVNQKNRDQAVEIFQNDNACRLFLGNIKAAGVGLNLTAASSVAFLEVGWSPGEHDQAEDRAHRIGQEDSVNVYYLLANETIEEEITRLIDKKRKVLDQVLDGKKTEEESLLSELMKAYT